MRRAGFKSGLGFGIESKIGNELRVCAHCSQVAAGHRVLCQECWREARRLSRSRPVFRPFYDIKVFSLFQWEGEPLLGSLIYGLKGGGFGPETERLAREFLVRRFSEERAVRPEDLVFVPAPARETGAPDHACAWASALAWSLSGGTVWNPLKRTRRAAQKHQKREERLREALEYSPDEEPLIEMAGELDGKKIIFTDDMITSGGTALAAYKALGAPSDFEVWTIGCRPRWHLL